MKRKRKYRRRANWVLPFGKYRGRDVSEVPYDYLQWLVNNLTDNQTIRRVEREMDARAFEFANKNG